MTKPLPPLVEHCVELFAPLGSVRPRAMFGGWGFYLDEHFFALIADDVLYLKTDAHTLAAFQDAGSSPFTYTYPDGRHVSMAYWGAPDAAMESPASMQDWARLALAAAVRAKASAGRRRGKPVARS